MKFRLIIALLAAAISAAAQTGAPADLSARVDQIVAAAMRQQQIPAMSVAAALDDHMVYSRAFGAADLENAVPATVETLFRTGSIAKPISAAAAMTLVDSGKLDLDAPLEKYCAPFPRKPWPITTRELLSHTAGIRHYQAGEIDSTRHYAHMPDGFAIFARDALLFQPGTAFHYSTYGYTVVGCVVEGASGERFQNYVAEHVLEPAGMTHTFVDDVFEIVPHRARGYQKIAGLVQMWTPLNPPAGRGTSNYGLGFGVLTIDGVKYVSHSGGQQGTSTSMVIIPERHFAVAALANMDAVRPLDVVRGILDLYHMPYPDRPAK
jgi:serine beta-lactamase-like protein LACTB